MSGKSQKPLKQWVFTLNGEIEPVCFDTRAQAIAGFDSYVLSGWKDFPVVIDLVQVEIKKAGR